jgi:hypothetical protein
MIGNRPDLSNYLAQFTRDGDPHGVKNPADPVNDFAKLAAAE